MEKGSIAAWIALAFSILSLATQFLTYRFNKNKENLSASVDRIKELEEALESVKKYALEYWLVDESASGAAGINLVSDLKNLSRNIGLCTDTVGQDAIGLVRSLKISATGGNFQSRHRTASSPQDQIVTDIISRHSALLAHLQGARHRLKM